MSRNSTTTENLLKRAIGGDRAAFDHLVASHRLRLKQVIALRLDGRLKSRVDPSDIVQETLVEAARRLASYIHHSQLPFFPWLRQIALDQTARAHRVHVATQRRSVRSEVPLDPLLSDESMEQLVHRMVSRGTAPDGRLAREEARHRVRQALAQLPERDREVLVLRYVEQLTGPEIAAILGVSEPALRMRHLLRLERLEQLLAEFTNEE